MSLIRIGYPLTSDFGSALGRKMSWQRLHTKVRHNADKRSSCLTVTKG